MKKIVFLSLACLMIMASCDNEKVLDTEEILPVSEMSVINGIPSYADMSTFYSFCVKNSLNRQTSFTSLWSLYEVANDELDEITNMDDYNSWKATYFDFFLFAEDENDQAIALKVENMFYAFGVNIYGEALIGGELINFNEIESIKYWNTEGSLLKSDRTPIGSVCSKYSSGGGRYMRTYQKSLFVENTYFYLVYIAGQKKNMFGWNNYSCDGYIRPVSAASILFHGYNPDNREVYNNPALWAQRSNPLKIHGKYMYVVYESAYPHHLKVWTDGVGEDHACDL
nr:DUF4848 domain-containing protein [uncultured Carboxylicivirga sp.]